MEIAHLPIKPNHPKRSLRFIFIPTATLVFGTILLLAPAAPAADLRAEPNPAEERFIQEEAASGDNFLKVAELGAKKATGTEVRALAETIVADLTLSNAALKPLASKRGVRLTENPIAKYGDLYDELVRTGGADLDNAFLAMIVTGHAASVKHLEEASLTTRESGLKEWAVKTLPLLQSHLKRATELNASLDANGTSQ
jgi:putative membrane protein